MRITRKPAPAVHDVQFQAGLLATLEEVTGVSLL